MLRRILAVGMVDSIHFAKWAELASSIADEILVLPSGPHRRLHPRILANEKVQVNRLLAVTSLPVWLFSKVFGFGWLNRVRALVLLRLVDKHSPEIIHIHEMQSGGYPLSAILEKTGLPVAYTPYGSDMSWFAQIPKHREKILQFLSRVSLVFPECERDAEMAKSLGFKGTVAPAMPASGYFEHNTRRSNTSGKEGIVLVKGYGGRWGLAPQFLEAMKGRSRDFANFELIVYSATRDTLRIARRLEREGFKISVNMKFSLSLEELGSLMNRAIVHVGLSRSDGQPASFVEAAIARCIPIQTDTACVPKLDLLEELNLLASPLRIDAVPDQLLRSLNNAEDLTSRLSDFFVWGDSLTNKEVAAGKLKEAYLSILK